MGMERVDQLRCTHGKGSESSRGRVIRRGHQVLRGVEPWERRVPSAKGNKSPRGKRKNKEIQKIEKK